VLGLFLFFVLVVDVAASLLAIRTVRIETPSRAAGTGRVAVADTDRDTDTADRDQIHRLY